RDRNVTGVQTCALPIFVLCFTKSFFPDDSQPVIVAVLTDSVLQAPCSYALTALLPRMNQLPPLDDSCGSLCLWYFHVLLSIVFQIGRASCRERVCVCEF